MAYFDFLNTPGKPVDADTRYWYYHDTAWDDSKGFFERATPVKEGRVVHRLKRPHEQSGYSFEFLDEPEKVYHCNYTWAFRECTWRNWGMLRLLACLVRIREALGVPEKALHRKLDTLKK